MLFLIVSVVVLVAILAITVALSYKDGVKNADLYSQWETPTEVPASSWNLLYAMWNKVYSVGWYSARKGE